MAILAGNLSNKFLLINNQYDLFLIAEALQAASIIDSNKKRSKRETFTSEEKRIAGVRFC